MIVKMKKLHMNATIPTKANEHDAGFDFTAVDEEVDPKTRIFTYKLGWAVEIPEGHVGLLFPRSSISKKDLFLTNAVGVIDSTYRGELMAKFKGITPFVAHKYEKGDRVVQLIVLPIPKVEFQVVEELSNTSRGEGSFGSSGS